MIIIGVIPVQMRENYRIDFIRRNAQKTQRLIRRLIGCAAAFCVSRRLHGFRFRIAASGIHQDFAVVSLQKKYQNRKFLLLPVLIRF